MIVDALLVWAESANIRAAVNAAGNTASKNRIDGFKIYQSNNNTMLRNTAVENGNIGFMVFDSASFNRIERNFARGNVFSDGYDEGTGTGNVWLANRFGTTIGF